jgi:hypothetical protein
LILTRLKRHITLIGLGFFVFPIIFQSIHIVWHHSNAHSESYTHTCCSLGKNCLPDKGSINISESDEHCPLCEYEFSVNNIPGFSVINTGIPYIIYVLNDNEIDIIYQASTSFNPPRAPPIFCQRYILAV